MRLSVIAGVLACAVFLLLNTKQAGAAPLEILQNAKEPTALAILDEVAGIDQPDLELASELDPIFQKHTVEQGESLSDIATRFNTTWLRLFYKNETIENPDVLNVGMELVIPSSEEELEERSLPIPPPALALVRPATESVRSVQSSYQPGDTSDNRYVRGYCTWYVKNRRPDLPNNLGNAITWASRAAAQGYATGSTPRVGAVGQQGNHVVYVESVNGDGTVTISEMNWSGWNVVSSRTVAASNFTYIY